MTATQALFVYGTLRDPAVQLRVIGRVTPGQPAILDGFARKTVYFTDGAFPMIEPDPVCSVPGEVIQVSVSELARIDRYETDAYQRIRVTLRGGAEVWVYAAPPDDKP